MKSVGKINPDGTMIGGIVVGYLLMIVSVALITYLNFYPWIHNTSHKAPISPELYFHCAIYTLVCMLTTGAILTKGWSLVDYDHTELMEWYGYNNICLVLDTPPSKYVMPSFWCFTCYWIFRYAIADSKRIWEIRHISKATKIFSLGTNCILVFVGSLFPVCLAIGPGDDMVAHTVVFLCLILALPLVYIAHWLQCQSRTWLYTSAIILYVCITCVKASFTITALVGDHLEARYAQFIDYLWLIFALPGPILSPPPHVEGKAPKDLEAKRLSFNSGAITAPLYLLLFPAVFVNFLSSALASIGWRTLNLVYRFTPDANLTHKYSISSSDAVVSPSLEKKYCPVKLANAYIQDMFGYIGLIVYSNIYSAFEKLGPVFAINIGDKGLACLDVKSSELLLLGQDVSSNCFASTLKMIDKDFRVNINVKGPVARKVRDLLLTLIPKSPDDEKFKSALYFARKEIHSWANLDAKTLDAMEFKEAIYRVIIIFATTMFLGSPLDPDLVDDSFPFPFAGMPRYPAVPKYLLPLWYKYSSALNSMREQSAICPFAGDIKASALASGFDENANYFDHLLIASCTNSMGLSCPLINALLILPLFPENGAELLRDEALLDSFVWELYRNTGPMLQKDFEAETDVYTSSNEVYRVKANTRLITILGLVQRDEVHWKDPHVFKVERFLKKTEPLPVLGWGCPLGEFDNEEQFNRSHNCIFMKLAHPFMKAFIKILVLETTYRLDSKSLAFMKDRLIEVSVQGTKTEDFILHVDFSLSHLCCGNNGTDQWIPKIGRNAHFSSFSISKKN